MKIIPHLRRVCIALTALAGCVAPPAHSAYPDRPITLIVPFSAGGTVDSVARLLAVQMGAELKTSVVVENAPGAGGTIATQRVARSKPDGLTLLFATPNHTINPAILHNLPFDTERDFAPISLAAQIPELLIANSKQPYSDFKGFVAYAKTHPGQLNYGSAGIGTLPHVTMELLLQKLGIKVTHIPYKGAAPAMNDLLGGQVAIKMDTIVTSLPQINAGRLKPLALASAKRSPLLPDVPTLAECGVAGYEGTLWMGILAPKGTPASVVDTVNQAIVQSLKRSALLKQFSVYGVEPVGSTPAAFQSQISFELKQWNAVVQRANITAN
ncbi:Bug family tripartite tricarboxylate transporter substrate binding protein [Paraburkholderia sp. RL17-373-BIF-A]|jgi:tripartite-type tricarboxylate transporter receptor subunit TctC|uniref:Bug family tripartite tricarboxylate transporter substrate binding protein n=1 Tax=Paraburkholderia sp. RL17-373-BIF-A TaxID=3031629 RepID=UPI0038BB0203